MLTRKTYDVATISEEERRVWLSNRFRDKERACGRNPAEKRARDGGNGGGDRVAHSRKCMTLVAPRSLQEDRRLDGLVGAGWFEDAFDPKRNGLADAWDASIEKTKQDLDPNKNGFNASLQKTKTDLENAFDPAKNGLTAAFNASLATTKRDLDQAFIGQDSGFLRAFDPAKNGVADALAAVGADMNSAFEDLGRKIEESALKSNAALAEGFGQLTVYFADNVANESWWKSKMSDPMTYVTLLSLFAGAIPGIGPVALAGIKASCEAAKIINKLASGEEVTVFDVARLALAAVPVPIVKPPPGAPPPALATKLLNALRGGETPVGQRKKMAGYLISATQVAVNMATEHGQADGGQYIETTATAPGGQETTYETPAYQRWNIYQALYGVPGKYHDGTEQLQEWLNTEGTRPIPGGLGNAFFKVDPAPGVIKATVVKYGSAIETYLPPVWKEFRENSEGTWSAAELSTESAMGKPAPPAAWKSIQWNTLTPKDAREKAFTAASQARVAEDAASKVANADKITQQNRAYEEMMARQREETYEEHVARIQTEEAEHEAEFNNMFNNAA